VHSSTSSGRSRARLPSSGATSVNAWRPRLDELATWLDAQLRRIPAKSDLGGAIRYARSRWPALTAYTDHGQLEISNNAAENAIRPVALGRKNWLFAGSDSGGERAALFYTLIRTAILNELEPEAYLRQVITRVGTHPVNRLHDLLPWNIAAPATHSRRLIRQPSSPQ
jgi:hypothetical protein